MPDDKTYYNPVDQKTYAPRDGWKTHKPETPAVVAPGQKVLVDHVRLLTAEQEIAVRIPVLTLSVFIKEIERLAHATFTQPETPFRLLVHVHATPTGQEIKLAKQGDAPADLLQTYHDALTALPNLPVQSGDVAFQLEMTVRA